MSESTKEKFERILNEVNHEEQEEYIKRGVDIAMRLPMDMSRIAMLCMKYDVPKTKAIELFGDSWDQTASTMKQVREALLVASNEKKQSVG